MEFRCVSVVAPKHCFGVPKKTEKNPSKQPNWRTFLAINVLKIGQFLKISFFVMMEKWENVGFRYFCNQFDQFGTQKHIRHVFKQSFILETLNLLTIWFGTISFR